MTREQVKQKKAYGDSAKVARILNQNGVSITRASVNDYVNGRNGSHYGDLILKAFSLVFEDREKLVARMRMPKSECLSA